MFAGDPQHPVTRALRPHADRYDITRGRLVEVVDGMRMDLEQNRYLDFPGLALYCRRVAGVVGEMASGIFGRTDPATLRYAETLGLAFQLTNIVRDVGEDARKGRLAFQLTNIVRDVGEDARKGRVYLPLDDLQRFGVTVGEILGARHSDRFVELMRFQAARARDTYRDAYALLPEVDRRAQRPGLIMSAIYSTLLEEIERDGFLVLDRRTSLTPIRKLWLAWRTWVTGRPPGFEAARRAAAAR